MVVGREHGETVCLDTASSLLLLEVNFVSLWRRLSTGHLLQTVAKSSGLQRVTQTGWVDSYAARSEATVAVLRLRSLTGYEERPGTCWVTKRGGK